MKEKLDKWLNGSSKNVHFLRLIVGSYIAYLGGSIILDRIKGESVETLGLVLAVFLTLVGAAIIAVCLYALIKHLSVEDSKADEGKAEQSEEDPEP